MPPSTQRNKAYSFTRILGYFVCIVSLSAQPFTARADTNALQDLLFSTKLKNKTKRSREDSQRWPKNKHNYRALFRSKGKAETVLHWLGTPEILFQQKGRYVRVRDRFLYVRSPLTYHDRSYSITVIIPKPASQRTAALRLIEEFREIDPPKSAFLKDSQHTIAGRQWRLFTTKDGVTHMSSTFAFEGLMRISKKGSSGDELTSVVGALDLDRFEQKLQL